MRRFAVALALCLAGWGCYRKVTAPMVVVPEKPLGDGGHLLRLFYRSFWEPPSSDHEAVTVGLMADVPSVSFRSDRSLVLRVYSEHESFEVLSPENTQWTVESARLVRPGLVEYLPVVEFRLFPASRAVQSSSENGWKERGFSESRWIGPPSMDQPKIQRPFQRWLLSLSPPGSLSEAERLCVRARVISGFCKVIAFSQLPPLAAGVLKSASHGFEKPFVGFVEIRTKRAPVELIDFIPEPRTQKTSAENYSTPLFIVPTSEKDLTVVQRTPLGDYLKAVVPSEIFAESSIEAVKAQTVVARTYMLRHLPEDAKAHPYGICASTLCQVYRGIEKRHPNTTRAVEKTESLVLWGDEGQPAETFYHSICAGHTEDKSVIWGPPSRTYLRGTSDREGEAPKDRLTEAEVRAFFTQDQRGDFYCGNSSYTNPERWRWERHIDASMLEAILKKLDLSPPLRSIEVLRRGRSGRVLAVRMTTSKASKVVTGELNFRMLFGGLLSSLVLVEPVFHANGKAIESLKIIGAGYGHGVGMCQVGAIGRAEHGASFEGILSAYYPGTTLAPIVLK